MRLPFDVTVVAGRQFINLWPEIATAILRTVKAGWTLALQSSQLGTGAGEVEITERLRDGMRSALDSGMLPWKTMKVLPGAESSSRPDAPAPDGRIDIPIQLNEIFEHFRVHDPHANIECKRVSGGDAHLCREYVVEGIDRFQSGKYSGNHSTGFMAGYLIAGDAKSAATRINNGLSHRSRCAENLRPSNLISEPWVWESLHPRTTNSQIVLHHAFLAFAES